MNRNGKKRMEKSEPIKRKRLAAKKTLVQMGEVLPPAITRLYEGKYIVFGHDKQQVIGIGETEDEAFKQADLSGVGGLWHLAYSDRSDDLYF